MSDLRPPPLGLAPSWYCCYAVLFYGVIGGSDGVITDDVDPSTTLAGPCQFP